MTKRCKWTPDDDGVWQTACGESFIFIDGSPEDNRTRFCCYCGREIWQAAYKEPK